VTLLNVDSCTFNFTQADDAHCHAVRELRLVMAVLSRGCTLPSPAQEGEQDTSVPDQQGSLQGRLKGISAGSSSASLMPSSSTLVEVDGRPWQRFAGKFACTTRVRESSQICETTLSATRY
jgi:hypothetical protein